MTILYPLSVKTPFQASLGIYWFNSILKTNKPHFPQTHLRTVSINMGQCHQNRQPKWNEVNRRLASLRVPSASTPNCGRRHWAWAEEGQRGGRKGRLLPPQPCLCPAHRRRSVFTPLDYKDPHFLSVNNSSFQAVTHESRWLTANQRYRRKQIKLTHSGCGIPAATCLFCCNWTRTRGPDVDSAWRVIACFLSSWQDNMRKTDWMTPTELL